MSACLATDTLNCVKCAESSPFTSANYAELQCWLFFVFSFTWGVMPVHQWCSGSWSLGRFCVQRQEPAQQNSPATIWSQSGCLSISKVPLPYITRAAARQQTDDLINERAKSLWCYAQKELKALLAQLGGLSFPPAESNESDFVKRAAVFACR